MLTRAPIIYIPHGGGPMPLLGEPSHHAMTQFLTDIAPTLGKPTAILLISAHWEQAVATVTGASAPPLHYDYSGFPDESYHYQYPAAGDPALAQHVADLLHAHNIDANIHPTRGFDHGMFVPLTIMFPHAQIPCVQLSLLANLDASAHINLGKALATLRDDNVLVIGSGFSFHNMRAFMSDHHDQADVQNQAFQTWLIDTCTNEQLTEQARETLLINWQTAPHARYCHPREEHLLPLHICYGMAQSAAELIFDQQVIGKQACAFKWI